MKEIQSIKARKGGEPTFKNRRLTINYFLYSLSQGMTLDEFANEYDIDKDNLVLALEDVADNIKSWMRPKKKYELWDDNDGGQTFLPATHVSDLINMNFHKKKRIWSVEADSWIEACNGQHEFLKREPYKPMLDENGNTYPEDEGDTV